MGEEKVVKRKVWDWIREGRGKECRASRRPSFVIPFYVKKCF